MPNGLMMADANFPRFSGGESTEQKITIIQNYLFQLTEELRWAHGNIGKENFNETEYQSISEEIQGPVIKRYESLDLVVTNGDAESSILLTGDGLKTEAKTITFSGMVTFKALGEDKENPEDFTLINGAYIKTGTLEAMTMIGGSIEGAFYKCKLIIGKSEPTGEIKMYYDLGEQESSAGGLRLEYDEGVSPNDPEKSKYRMRLYTKSGTRNVSLKLESAYRMSLEADGVIYIGTSVDGGVHINAPTIDLDAGVVRVNGVAIG